MWDHPTPGIEPMSLALQGGFLTTGPPGKSYVLFFKCLFYNNYRYTRSYKDSAELPLIFHLVFPNGYIYITIIQYQTGNWHWCNVYVLIACHFITCRFACLQPQSRYSVISSINYSNYSISYSFRCSYLYLPPTIPKLLPTTNLLSISIIISFGDWIIQMEL